MFSTPTANEGESTHIASIHLEWASIRTGNVFPRNKPGADEPMALTTSSMDSTVLRVGKLAFLDIGHMSELTW